MIRRRVLLTCATLLLGACAVEANPEAAPAQAGADDVAAVEQAIRDRVAAWQAAANESPEAFASFYTEDGILMAPNAPPAQGRQAIAELMAPTFAQIDDITFTPLQITAARSGELAAERGRYDLRGTAPDGTTFEDQGSYVVVWRLEGDQWLVINDVFNSDRPTPEGH